MVLTSGNAQGLGISIGIRKEKVVSLAKMCYDTKISRKVKSDFRLHWSSFVMTKEHDCTAITKETSGSLRMSTDPLHYIVHSRFLSE